MEHLDIAPRLLKEPGVEIGAFKTPIPGIKPVYVDLFAAYANEPTHADFYGDACALPYHDSSLRYVASSHVLEHVANPLAALAEWHRVLEHGGCIYMVVPDWRRTFDHRRALTGVPHMVDDFRKGVTQCDATHIDDFAYGVDWATFSPATAPADEKRARDELAATYHRSVAAGLEINIHFHTFELASVVSLIEAGNREALWPGSIDVRETVDGFPGSNPNGFLVVAHVRKKIRRRLGTLLSPKGLRADARRP